MGKLVNILGVNFISTNKEDLVKTLSNRLLNQEKTFIITANPEIVMYSLKDADYKAITEEATYVIADGIGVIKAAALLNDPLPERIPGFELMLELLKVADDNKLKIYLLGSQDDVLKKTTSYINENYPNSTIVGSHHGFFDWENNTINEQIAVSQPDIVFVALGVPRQEKWISENIDSFQKGIFMGIGGSFDVLAGTVKRAPEIWQKLNAEWLYRLIKQPWRWKRMMALPIFVLKILHQKINGKKY